MVEKRYEKLDNIDDFNDLPSEIKKILYNSSLKGSIWVGSSNTFWDPARKCSYMWLVFTRKSDEGTIIFAGVEYAEKKSSKKATRKD